MDSIRKITRIYVLITLVGFALLSLPMCHVTSVSFIDNLFVSVSAVSTTGLSTIDLVESYTFWGQLVIILLVQIGGLGYMTFMTFILLSLHHRISKKEMEVIKSDLNLPDNYGFRDIIKVKLVLTLIFEVIGVILFYIVFSAHSSNRPVWDAIFHSISSFCTAGFNLFSDDFGSIGSSNLFRFNIIGLSLIGSLGFIVFSDIYRVIIHKQRKLTLSSKVILSTMGLALLLGTTFIFFTEVSFEELQFSERLILSFFHTVSAITTVGFSVVPLNSILPATLFIFGVYMLIGSSPSGTGGGLKSGTVRILFSKILNSLRGINSITLFGSQIPAKRVNLAVTSFLLFILLLVLSLFLLLWTEKAPFLDLFFEASSAIATAGLSTGITEHLTTYGKIVIIFLMFVGRLSPLALGLLFFKQTKKVKAIRREDLSI